MQPLYTILSEAVGRKGPLYVAFLLFGGGSIAFACAESLPGIIVARVLQGSGCGGIDVLNEVIAADITTLQERAFYIGLMSVPFAVGSALGPVLGAALNEYASWRWIGWINLPLIGTCLPLTYFCLQLAPPPGSLRARLSKVDWYGIIIFAIGSLFVTLPLSWAGVLYPWRSWETLAPLAAGVVVLGVLVWYESKPVQPLFPHRIVRNRAAATALMASFIHGLIFYTLVFHLPLLFQSVYLDTPVGSSISLLSLFVVAMTFTGVAAAAIQRTHRCRLGVWLAWVSISLGVGLFALWGRSRNTAQVVVFQAIAAIGLGSLFTLLPIMVQASAHKEEDQGLAVGVLVCFRLFGASIGLPVSATAFSYEFGKSVASLRRLLPEHDGPDANQALAFIAQLREAELSALELDAVETAYLDSFRVIFYMLAAFGCLGFLASLLMRDVMIQSEKSAALEVDEISCEEASTK